MMKRKNILKHFSHTLHLKMNSINIWTKLILNILETLEKHILFVVSGFLGGIFLEQTEFKTIKKTEKYLRFNDAKRYINKYIKAKTSVEYKKYIKDKHIDFLPNKPFRFYKDKGWNGWEDYLSIKKKYQITNDLIARYLKRFFPNVTGNYTFRKNKLKIHRSIHLGIIKNFDFKLLKN